MYSTKQSLSIVYRIDLQNRITSVNQAWTEFASENSGETVLPEQVLGSDLISSISDHTIQELYRSMISQARRGRPVNFKYRCDAPDKRRLFSMRITKTSGDEVEFVSTLANEELRESVAFLENNQPRNGEFLRVCSWCQQVALPPDRWVPVEEAVEETGMMKATELPAITHGICPNCLRKMVDDLDDTSFEIAESIS